MILTLSPRDPLAPPPPVLQFPPRAQRDQTHTADRRIWTAFFGRYRVVEMTSFFIRGPRRCRRVTITAEVSTWVGGVRRTCWAVMSRHKTIQKAFEACQKAADDEDR